MNEQQDLINKINHNKKSNIPIFDGNTLNSVHNKVLGRVTGADRYDKNKEIPGKVKMDAKVEEIIAADKGVRQAIQDLVISLSELGDKDIAMKLIGQHILFLNDMFKEFEGNDKTSK